MDSIGKHCSLITVFSAALFFAAAASFSAAQTLSPKERLGKSIFFDESLSLNKNMSCATCHMPEAGWSGPHSGINAAGAVYEGSVTGRFGNRRPPTASYATQSPVFGFEIEEGEPLFIGGNFWNGRATGKKLGNAAAEQSQAPFLNPVEQALPGKECVVYRVCNPSIPDDYPVSVTDVFGRAACNVRWPEDMEKICSTDGAVALLSDRDKKKVEQAYDNIALALAAFEASSEVNAFTSKFDYAYKAQAVLGEEERKGLALFRGKGKCEDCHPSKGPNPLFTDYTFDNLGFPRNPDNSWYEQKEFNPSGRNWLDEGLGGFLSTDVDYMRFAGQNLGKHKVPTLRNAGLGSCESGASDCIVKAFGHNGYFKSLKTLVHFYNTRDVKKRCENPFTKESDAIAGNCWPEPEIAANVNTEELGDLGLTPSEEEAIVAFLMTLSDGYAPDLGKRDD